MAGKLDLFVVICRPDVPFNDRTYIRTNLPYVVYTKPEKAARSPAAATYGEDHRLYNSYYNFSLWACMQAGHGVVQVQCKVDALVSFRQTANERATRRRAAVLKSESCVRYGPVASSFVAENAYRADVHIHHKSSTNLPKSY